MKVYITTFKVDYTDYLWQRIDFQKVSKDELLEEEYKQHGEGVFIDSQMTIDLDAVDEDTAIWYRVNM